MKRAMDRRIRRTRALLHEALLGLIHEKPYDAIVIKEVLERADVGRSTFYAHFRDKHELLASVIHDLLGSFRADRAPSSAGPGERLLSFSLPLFEHIDQHRRTVGPKLGSTGRAALHEQVERALVKLVVGEIAKESMVDRKSTRWIAPELLARYLASTFVLVLSWWLEHASTLGAGDADGLYRRLTMPTLDAMLH